MRIKMTTLGEARCVISTKNSLEQCEDVNKMTKIFLIKEKWKDGDLLLETTKIHKTMAK